MKHRWAELLAAETITAAATKTIDIDLMDPISRLSVLIKLTNNTSTPYDHPDKVLQKLEIVDGSDVLASLNGMETRALNFYERSLEPYANLIYLNDVMCLLEYNINFGRFLWDKELALDPKKFKNPQIKIQHSLGIGGSTPDSMDLRVRADVFDEEAPAPTGFLMPKEIYSYLPAQSGNEYIDLPTDYPIRILMPLSRAASKAPYEQYNQLKLTEDMDKKTILEGYTSDFQKVVAGLYPTFKDLLFGNAQVAGVAHFITPCFDAYPSLNAEGTSAQIYAEAFVNGGTKTIYGDVASNFHGIYTGRCPHGALGFPMGNLQNPEEWWDVSKLKSARIKVTAGSSADTTAAIQIVLQQHRKY